MAIFNSYVKLPEGINGYATGTISLEVLNHTEPTFFRPKFQGISPENKTLYGTVPPF